jgi:uncharacterized membrane protein YraQ (UPF0718 family)
MTDLLTGGTRGVSPLLAILHLAAAELWQLLPYVLLGVLAGEGLRYTPMAPLVDLGCRRHPAVAIPGAAVLGIVSPLCTYGTVPLVLQLLRAGVPVAPLATFLSASSLMNPQLLLISWGGLGPRIAMARLASVFVFALLLGTVMHFLPRSWLVSAELRADEPASTKPRPRFTFMSYLGRSGKTLQFVGFYVLLGVLLGAIIEVLVPGRWIMAIFGRGGWYQVLLASLLGVPLYACGGGVIPLIRALIERGMAPAAALAFLIAGPATRVPPLMALATILRPAVVVGYVILLIAYSVMAGLVFGLF